MVHLRSIYYIVCPGISDYLSDHTDFGCDDVLNPNHPTHIESKRKFCVTKLQAKQESNDHQIPIYVPIIFFILDFSKSSFLISQESIVAAWARDTDGNLFPLCRSTALTITFDKSINNATQLDRVCVQEPL